MTMLGYGIAVLLLTMLTQVGGVNAYPAFVVKIDTVKGQTSSAAKRWRLLGFVAGFLPPQGSC